MGLTARNDYLPTKSLGYSRKASTVSTGGHGFHRVTITLILGAPVSPPIKPPSNISSSGNLLEFSAAD